MAYKFFSQKLLSSNQLDLTQVFPEKQEIARDQNNVSYNLADIVLFLKDRTEDFKFVEGQYIDLDNAINEIVNKYYKSIGEKNPFIDDIDEESLKQFEAGVVPREAVIVEEGKQKGKGIAKPAPSQEPKKSKESKVKEVIVEEVKLSEKGIKFKNDLQFQKEVLYDDVDDAQKENYKLLMQEKLEANELMADDGDEDFVERVQILKEFIKSLK
jgi:hypothetical protein